MDEAEPLGLSNRGERPPLLRRRGFWAGTGLALAVAAALGGLGEGRDGAPGRAAGVVVLMAAFWFAEVLPIGVTALFPLLLFPLLGVFPDDLLGNVQESAWPYLDAYMFLFLGGMMLGAAMEATGLHRRTALLIMRAVGTGPKRLLLGILVATAAVSAFVSNTATAVMMVPIACALVGEVEGVAGRKLPGIGTALLLAVAYGANVGGIATKIGTGTNSIFCGLMESLLGRSIGFLEFMALGVPFVLLFLPIAWAVLWRSARKDKAGSIDAAAVVHGALAELGPVTGPERKVICVFLFAATGWIGADLFRPLVVPFARELLSGFEIRSKHYEAGISMTAGILVLLLRVMPWRAFGRLPWGSLLLLGGSFSMAAGVEASGLSERVSSGLRGLADQPLFLQLLAVSALSVGMSAVASNTATVNVLLNVLPRSFPLFATAAIGSSCDFMLPAGTPPNAIVFGSGRVRLRDMMRIGSILDLLAILLVPAWVFVHGILS